MNREFLSVKDLAQIGLWSEKTIYSRTGPKATKSFPIRVIRLGRSVFFAREDVDRFIEKLKEETK